MFKWSVLFLLFPLFSLSQTVEFGEVRWDEEHSIQWKLHVKEVIPFENRSIDEIHALVESWYLDEFFTKGMVYTYRFDEVNGDRMWQAETEKPFAINDSGRIFSKPIRCTDCMIAWPRRKLRNRVDGFYRMDFRIKGGRALLVISDHYVINDASYLVDWLVKKGKLVDHRDDRVKALELEFARIRENLLEYALRYQDRYPEANRPDGIRRQGADDW